MKERTKVEQIQKLLTAEILVLGNSSRPRSDDLSLENYKHHSKLILAGFTGLIDDVSREYLQRMQQVNAPPFNELTPHDAREVTKLLDRIFRWEPKAGANHREMTIPGRASRIPVRISTPRYRGKADWPVLLYFHGGGWVVGSHTDPDVTSTCAFLANASRCVVISVGYRLAPENKFPAAVEDAYDALNWVAGNPSELNVVPSRIAVCGDSAGGNIAAVLCMMARDRKGPTISLQVLAYPVTNYSFETESYLTCGEGYGLSIDEMKWYWNHYLLHPADGENPYASPLRAKSLDGLPPALILTAENDPLRSEGEAYAARLEQAGVPAKMVRYAGTIHGFFTLPFGGKGRTEAAAELWKAFWTE